MRLHTFAHLNPGTKEETQGLPSTWWQDQEAQHREFKGIRLNSTPHQKGANFRPRRVLNVSPWKQTFFVKHHHRINLPNMTDLWAVLSNLREAKINFSQSVLFQTILFCKRSTVPFCLLLIRINVLQIVLLETFFLQFVVRNNPFCIKKLSNIKFPSRGSRVCAR